MNFKQIALNKRRTQRAELREIERKLHPLPVVNGHTIMHEHRGQLIEFTAWNEKERFGGRGFATSRTNILAIEYPYVYFESDFQWLTEEVK